VSRDASSNGPQDDAFSNAVSNSMGGAPSNAATGATGRYRLEVAELRETGTPGECEPGPFRNPFAPAVEEATDGDAAFDSEQEALDAWADALAGAGVVAELSDGPGAAIRHQRAPCYRLTDAQGGATHVLVRIGAVRPI